MFFQIRHVLAIYLNKNIPMAVLFLYSSKYLIFSKIIRNKIFIILREMAGSYSKKNRYALLIVLKGSVRVSKKRLLKKSIQSTRSLFAMQYFVHLITGLRSRGMRTTFLWITTSHFICVS